MGIETALSRLEEAGIKLNANHRRDLAELIGEISGRDGLRPAEVMEEPRIRVLLGSGLNGPQKLKLVKKTLWERRYPVAGGRPALPAADRQAYLGNSPPGAAVAGAPRVERLLIERSVAAEPLTMQVLEKFSGLPVDYLDRAGGEENAADGVFGRVSKGPAEKWSGRSKLENAAQSPGCKADEARGEGAYVRLRDRTEGEENAADGVFGRASQGPGGTGDLLIARNQGRFVKKCPGTPVYQCCDYYVLNLGIGCFSNCHYCYLHHYMNTPFTVYANIGDLVAEVTDFCARRAGRVIRLGSGEFIDSVGIDEIANINEILVPALSRITNLVFEIKTKSRNIEHLLDLEHRGRVVISWSVNSEEMIGLEEPETDPLKERLAAAATCQAAGYRIGWHFDPLIDYPGWEAGYKRTVDMVFDSVDPANIAWISLGALRFNPALKPIIKRKFPASRLPYGELLPGLDGKLRYPLSLRREMFARIIGYIWAHSIDVPIYLCMENKELAEEVGAIPGFRLAQQAAFG